MTEFSKDFVSSIEGTSLEISTKELSGGARVYYIFNEVFGHALQGIDPSQNLSLADIRTAIRNSTGPRPSLFVPEVAFDLLVKPQIKLLEAPSLRCVELVYEELMKICHNCTSPVRNPLEFRREMSLQEMQELQRFPRLLTQLVEVVSDLLRERLGPTSDYVSSLISIQAAYINTNHPDFVAGSAAIARAGAPSTTQIPKVQEPTSEVDDEESEGESEVSAPNGYVTHPRSASASVPDIRRPTTALGAKETKSRKHIRTASGSHSGPISGAKQGANALLGAASAHNMAGTSPHTAKETFLNYFFGGPNGAGDDIGNVQRALGKSSTMQHHAQGQYQPQQREKDLLPDLGGRRGGRLENSASFDMKSLGKHLEAVSRILGLMPMNCWANKWKTTGDQLQLTPREEMETTLIRSLIASYFGITRQTIQDLVPKAIMHLLVSNILFKLQNNSTMLILCQVNFSRDAIQQRLVTQLYKPELFADLLFEDEALVSERTRVKALLDAYKEAFKVLSEVSLKST